MRIVLFGFIVTLFAHAGLHAQPARVNTADSVGIYFIKSVRERDKETVTLQTDRNIYAAGEKIWFKAFLMEGLNNKIDTTSKNLFVDLVNDKDSIINQLVLNAVALRTNGAITLNDSLEEGYYWLRCYTQNIAKTDSAAMCVQPVYIINQRNKAAMANVQETGSAGGLPASPVIHFYPEGGALIAGVNSAGALQVTDAGGNPVIARGTVINDHDSVIAIFNTNRFGLAKISFYPVWFQKYTAVIHVGEKDIKYPLPAWDPFAAQIAVASQNSEAIQVHVALEDSIYSRRFTTFLLAVNKDKVCFAGVGHGMYTLDVPLKNFPGGIATFLLFDDKQNLLSERKIFINKSNYDININADKENYAAREAARLDINVTDGDGKTMIAALNVSVQDNRILQASDEIRTDTVMPASTGELNDWLKQHRNMLSAGDADLLMMSRQPEYKNLLSMPAAGLPHTDSVSLLLYLRGKIANRQGEALNDKIVTAMSMVKSKPYFDADTTNALGSFKLRLPFDMDSLVLGLQVTGRRGVQEPFDNILLDTFKFPHVATPPFLKRRFAVINTVAEQALRKYHIDTFFSYTGKDWLKPITVKTTARPATADYEVSKRLSPFSTLITRDKLGHGGSGELGYSILKIPGVTLMAGKVVIRGGAGRDASEPLLVVDGVPVRLDTSGPGVMDYLNTLDYSTIDFIEVLKGPEAAIYGTRGADGVISVNTRPFMTEESRPGFKIVKPVMYHIAPKFFMPDYADKHIKNSKTPDPRTTIYWNGDIITTTDGKAAVGFYTADEPTNYTVTVTGITGNGEYIYKRITLSRK